MERGFTIKSVIWHFIRPLIPTDSQDRRSISRSSTQSSTSFTNCREPEVTRFIQRHVPDAKLSQETLRELTYTLPAEAAKKGQFEKLFDALEEACQVLEVSDYGLMDTSLEEVFLKVTDSTGVNSEGKTLCACDTHVFCLLI